MNWDFVKDVLCIFWIICLTLGYMGALRENKKNSRGAISVVIIFSVLLIIRLLN